MISLEHASTAKGSVRIYAKEWRLGTDAALFAVILNTYDQYQICRRIL